MISTVIVAYNEEKHIENCIKSILGQNKKSDEVIVVDDGSSDRTLEIARKYPVKVMRTDHQERSRARNIGWQTAKGDIVCFAEADSTFDRDWLCQIERKFSNGAKAVIDRRALWRPKTFIQRSLQADFDLRYQNYVPFNAWAMSKEVLRKTGGFDPRVIPAEDRELGTRIKKEGFEIEFAPKAIQYHHGEPDSLVSYLKRCYWTEFRRFKFYQQYPGDIPKKKLFSLAMLAGCAASSIYFGYLSLLLVAIMLAVGFMAIFYKNLKLRGNSSVPLRHILGLSFLRLCRSLLIPVVFIISQFYHRVWIGNK